MSHDNDHHLLAGLPILPGAPLQIVLLRPPSQTQKANRSSRTGIQEGGNATSNHTDDSTAPVDLSGPFAECRFCKGKGCLVCPTERERAARLVAGQIAMWLTPIKIDEPPPNPSTFENLGTLRYQGADQLSRMIEYCVPGPEMIMEAKTSGDYTSMRAHILAGKARYLAEGGEEAPTPGTQS